MQSTTFEFVPIYKAAHKWPRSPFNFKLNHAIINAMGKTTVSHLGISNNLRLFITYLYLSVLYVGLVYLAGPTQSLLEDSQYSDNAVRWLSLSFRLPLIAIWLLSFYGYSRLHRYTVSIADHNDGRHFQTISKGLLCFAIGLPLSFIVGSVATLLSMEGVISSDTVAIIRTYATLLIALFAFSLITKGAYGLSTSLRRRPSLRSIRIISLLSIAVGVVYCFLIFNRDTTNPLASPMLTNPSYLMPNWLVLTTIVIPYLYAWVIGICGALELLVYQRYTSGKLYRKALLNLTIGVGTVVAASIAAQYLVTLSQQLLNLSAGWLFITVYCLYAFIAYGFILIALGARRLQKIEEV